MKASYSASLFLAITATTFVLLLMIHSATAATCNPLELAVCSKAISSPAPPSAACCAKLKEQQPCFCQYKKNPALTKYFISAQAQKVATACNVAIPNC